MLQPRCRMMLMVLHGVWLTIIAIQMSSTLQWAYMHTEHEYHLTSPPPSGGDPQQETVY